MTGACLTELHGGYNFLSEPCAGMFSKHPSNSRCAAASCVVCVKDVLRISTIKNSISTSTYLLVCTVHM